METGKSVSDVQNVANIKQNTDEQVAQEKEDLHCETRPESVDEGHEYEVGENGR